MSKSPHVNNQPLILGQLWAFSMKYDNNDEVPNGIHNIQILSNRGVKLR
jgi:hypothetical protein